ncbi:MAG TPA: SDR family oxidoreductase [Pyrinomonadaceae bacterium]|nr:SDR family oxidoreductase [Pyrinomonadaceae bacterium]
MALRTKPIADQVALVTGGGTGIGRAFTEALGVAGVKVVIASRREEVVSHTAHELNLKFGAERVFPYAFDIRERREIDALVGQVIEQHGTLDILVNNSGLAVPETVDQITENGWDKVMDTNLRGVMQLVRATLPNMIANQFGDIVNISSQAGKHGYADVPSYCASKFGLLGYAESLRDHVRKTGANIRVFNLCPGLVDVENTAPGAKTKPGFIHVANMARTLIYVLALDREVVLEDINIYAR